MSGNRRHAGGVASAMANLQKSRERWAAEDMRQLLVEARDTIKVLVDPSARAPFVNTDIMQRLDSAIASLDPASDIVGRSDG